MAILFKTEILPLCRSKTVCTRVYMSTCLHVYKSTCLHVYMSTCLLQVEVITYVLDYLGHPTVTIRKMFHNFFLL